jgi:hypothetical protein
MNRKSTVAKVNLTKPKASDPTYGLPEYQDLLQNVEHFSKTISARNSNESNHKPKTFVTQNSIDLIPDEESLTQE